MSRQLRIGMVGTSWYSDLIHLPQLHEYPRASVAAICGRNRERADELAAKYSIPQVFTDYREMIDKGGLEALVVATTDDTHHPIVMAALEAGLHVMCEKPLAINIQQAREMYGKAEAAGIKHAVFFTNRWVPLMRYIKELVDEGHIGRCYECSFQFFMGFGREKQYAWRFDRTRGNGMLADLGSHMADLARWFVGDLAAVSADLTTFVERPGADGGKIDPANDSVTAVLRFQNGAHGTLHVSALAHTGQWPHLSVSLYGTQGTLQAVYDLVNSQLYGARSAESSLQPMTIPDRIWGAGDRNDIFRFFQTAHVGSRLFVDSILDDTHISPNFYDGLKAQEFIDAAIRSHETGTWATLA